MRLTKLTTATGDRGTTHIHMNQRASKGSAIIQAIGKVDSLNAQIGMLDYLCKGRDPNWLQHRYAIDLLTIQNALFNLGAELFMGGETYMVEADLEALEHASTMLNRSLPPLAEFILPRGNKATCQAHICRTVCREAECLVVDAKDEGAPINPLVLRYLNRLSDYFFNLARVLSDAPEQMWDTRKPETGDDAL